MVQKARNREYNATGMPDRIGLTADAILASFFHRQGKAVPFFYNFVDYLTILGCGSNHLTVALSAHQRCASTNPANHLRRPPNVTPFVEIPTLAGEALKIAFEPLDDLDSEARGEGTDVLFPVFASLKTQAGTQYPDIERALVNGLKTVIEAAGGDQPAINFKSPSAMESPSTPVGAIIDRTAKALMGSVRAVSSGYCLGVRYHYDSHWHVMNLQYFESEPKWKQFDSAWLPPASNSFSTGFASWSNLGGKKSFLCVPCHFGGIPWILLCREFEGSQYDRWWQAYATYRDVMPRMNYSLRLLAQSSFSKEMLRTYSEFAPEYHNRPGAMREGLEKAWSVLSSVYPIPRPRLKPFTATDQVRSLVIPFVDGKWLVDFSDQHNPFLVSQSALTSSSHEAWSRDLLPVLESEFVNLFTKQQAEHSRDEARTAYSVGHPLGKRFEAVLTGMTKLRNEIGLKLPENSWLRDSTQRLAVRVETCKRTAEIMDFMGNILRGESLDHVVGEKCAFFSSTAYAIAPSLRNAKTACNEALGSEVVTLSGEEAIQELEVGSFIGQNKNVRPFDALYDELLYEIMLNAGRKSGMAKVTVDLNYDIPRDDSRRLPAIVFSNNCVSDEELQKLKLKLKFGCWNEWPRHSLGGLRFLEDVLRVVSAGTLHVFVDKTTAGYKFILRLGLEGLSNHSTLVRTGKEGNV